MIQYWVIPPEANCEFVANMEEVMETYERPNDSALPIVCMDEQLIQLLNQGNSQINACQQTARTSS